MPNDTGLSDGLLGEALISHKRGDSELKKMRISPSYDEIARLAHRFWEERGCPDGSAEEDWLRAEKALASPHEP